MKQMHDHDYDERMAEREDRRDRPDSHKELRDDAADRAEQEKAKAEVSGYVKTYWWGGVWCAEAWSNAPFVKFSAEAETEDAAKLLLARKLSHGADQVRAMMAEIRKAL